MTAIKKMIEREANRNMLNMNIYNQSKDYAIMKESDLFTLSC